MSHLTYMFATQKLSLDQAEIAYLDRGTGDPLVFVHGFPLSKFTWRKAFPAFESSYRCIAPDLMGIGETAVAPSQDLSVASQAKMLIAFFDALQLPRVTLIAHDSGAVIVSTLAAAHPERVSRLVLFDTDAPGHIVRSAVVFQKILEFPGAGHLVAELMRIRGVLRFALGITISDHGAMDMNEFVETTAEPLLSSPERRRTALKFLVQQDPRSMDTVPFHRLTMPKLILWGARDTIFPLAWGTELYERLPDPKRFVEIPASGVFPHEERPDVWSREVASFLEHGYP